MVEIVVIVEWHICVPPGLVNVSKFMHSLMSDTANMAPSKLVPNTEPKSIDHVLMHRFGDPRDTRASPLLPEDWPPP